MAKAIATVVGVIAAIVLVVYGSFALYEGSWSLAAHNAKHQQQIQQQRANAQASFNVNGTAGQYEAYNRFYDLYGNYKSDLEAVATNYESLMTFQHTYTPAEISADPTGNLVQILGQDQASLTASQQACTRDAEQYNNDSKEVKTGAIYKGVDLSKQVSVLACEKGSING